ncbi:MAG: hypothetical protein HKM98_05765, partial [Gammaproteobacteria bacterium]|nr:hypothetical protein [Gammaproteobacteria bacterium]
WRSRIAQIRQENRIPTPAAPATAAAEPSRILQLQQQLKKRDEIIAALQSARTIRSQGDADTSELQTQLSETTDLCRQLQGHVAEQRAAVDQLSLKLERVTAEKETLLGRLREREAEIGRMGQERQHAIKTIASLQKEIREERVDPSEADEDANETATPEQRPEPAEQSDSTASAESTAAPTATATPSPSLPEQPSGSSQRQQKLPMPDSSPAATSKDYAPTWLLTEPRGNKDNLQAIYGIGPKLESQLNSLGIFHFEQIANFKSNDILWVARHLKSFPGRIVRDQWIQQAEIFLNKT